MQEVFLDALMDSAKMIPWLFFIYLAIEYMQHRFGHELAEKTSKAGKAGPLIGAAFGCIPQCGFSVIATTFYVGRIITFGTLIAVYLSTSDEALPVILSQPDKIGYILPLIATKVIIATIAGYILDYGFRKRVLNSQADTHKHIHVHEDHIKCCGVCTAGEDEDRHHKLDIKELFIHPILHTIKVFVAIFAITLTLGLIINQIGEENIGNFMLTNTIFQPLLTGLIGLIPNCASSVIITELFLKGSISFGSVISGLCTGAGLGLIVLFKENKNMFENLKIVSVLYAIGAISGIIIQFIWG